MGPIEQVQVFENLHADIHLDKIASRINHISGVSHGMGNILGRHLLLILAQLAPESLLISIQTNTSFNIQETLLK